MWASYGIYRLSVDVGIWKYECALHRRCLDFCAACARMCDAEMAGKSEEFLSAMGKSVAMYLDITVKLGYQIDLTLMKSEDFSYAVDLATSGMAWAYAASGFVSMKTSNCPKLGREFLGHVWNCTKSKMPKGTVDNLVLATVAARVGKYMDALAVSYGLSAAKYRTLDPSKDVSDIEGMDITSTPVVETPF